LRRFVASSGIQGDGGWVPAFPGQRPPLAEGNEVAVKSGAYSERRVGEVAERFRAALLGSASTPAYLLEERFVYSVNAWSRAEGVVYLIGQWLDGQDIEEALTELTVATEEEDRGAPGEVRRRLRQRKTAPALDALHRWEGRAASLRRALGLDPVSFAELSRNVALTSSAHADALEALGRQGREIMERRGLHAVQGGSGDSGV
jgi:hypothetical protein